MPLRRLLIDNGLTDGKRIDKYLSEIGKIPLLSTEEEIFLTRKIKQGNKKALDKLVKSNLRFVISVAKQYERLGLDIEDLISEGNIGLIKAAKRFDETRGFKFISYAVWWIRQSIMGALNDKSRLIKIPSSKFVEFSKINNKLKKMEQEYGRDISENELDLNDKERKFYGAHNLIKNNHHSLDKYFTDDDKRDFVNVLTNENSLGPEKKLIYESLKKDLKRYLNKCLDRRELKIIEMFYGIDKKRECTLKEIAKEMNLTNERVRQIKEKSMKKLKFRSYQKNLKEYL